MDNFQEMFEQMSQRLDTDLQKQFSFLKRQVETISLVSDTERREEGRVERRSGERNESGAQQKRIYACRSRQFYQDAKKYIFKILDDHRVDLSHDSFITKVRRSNTMTKSAIEHLFEKPECKQAFEVMFSSKYLEKVISKEKNPRIKARLLQFWPNLEQGFRSPQKKIPRAKTQNASYQNL